MKRSVSALILALIMALTPVISASGAVKAGAACSKLNAATTVSGIKYKCIKSGKKLVWNKGVKVTTSAPSVLPIPSAAPTPYPTPSATPMPSPTQTVTPKAIAPASFSDLQARLDGVIYGAWLKASEKINVSTTTLGSTQILVGPNTVEDDSNSLVTLNLASKLFGGFSQVKNLYIIKFSKSDIDWAQKQYDLLRPNNYSANAALSRCSGPNGCDGAMAGINSAGAGVIMMGQGGNYMGQPTVAGTTRAQNGQVSAHEYIHTIQMINASCRGGRGCYGDAPQWLLEGGAEWAATAARFSGNFDDFLKFRDLDLSSQYSQSSSIYTFDYIDLYLNPKPVFLPNQDNWAYWGKYNGWDAYALGFMVTEILVNVKGIDSYMKLYEDVGSGKSFVEAFQGIFGLTWAEACPIIADAIASELKQGIRK